MYFKNKLTVIHFVILFNFKKLGQCAPPHADGAVLNPGKFQPMPIDANPIQRKIITRSSDPNAAADPDVVAPVVEDLTEGTKLDQGREDVIHVDGNTEHKEVHATSNVNDAEETNKHEEEVPISKVNDDIQESKATLQSQQENPLENLQSHQEEKSLENHQSHQEANLLENHQSHQEASPLENHQSQQEASPLENHQFHQQANLLKNHQSQQEASPLENHQSQQEASPLENHQSHQEANPLENHQFHQEANPLENLQPHQEVNPLENLQSHPEEKSLENHQSQQEASPLENLQFHQEEKNDEYKIPPEMVAFQEALQNEDGNTEADEMLSSSNSSHNSDQEKATAIPQLYGAGKLLHPVQNYESEGGRHGGRESDEDGGFVAESPDSLKSHVHTTVLEAEVVTDAFECSGIKGPLRPLAAESKYFVDKSRLYNFLEARDVCEKYNLVIAEVEELADHRTIARFMKAGDYHEIKGSTSGSRFFIGLNDAKTEGVFRHANGKNCTYQDFLPSQPDDENKTEDCVTIMKEHRDGPSGAADYDCKKPAHVFCMFRIDTQCYNDSKETIENRKLASKRELHLLVNATERAYFISNYQATWKNAMKECDNKEMKLFDMDGVVTMGFFRSILRWENNFFRISMPTVQYWTSGKFQKSHMSAPIIWRTNPDPTESEERGVEKQNATFSFSGIFHWSTKKKADPGGPHGWRRDLCVSFGLDNSPEEIPYVRNTNCDLPAYFICYVENPESDGDDEEETTTERITTEAGPINPDDVPLPIGPVNETEIAEIEEMMEKEGRGLNITCSTKDEDKIKRRNGIIGAGYRWSSGFYVYIDPRYNKAERKLINAAMYELQRHLCIQFYLFRRNQQPYGNYVHIQDNGPFICESEVGKIGRGAQEMSLGYFCLQKGIIMHELIHALGFWHEQSRPDRDQYVTINWSNIKQGFKSHFEKVNGSNTYGVPYNLNSIMHYQGSVYSVNGKPTIVAKNGRPVGTKNVLQNSDIQKLRKMYNCK